MKLPMATSPLTPKVRLAETDAQATMPTTADAIYRAAAMLAPILPADFYGKVTLIYEAGQPQRMVKEESLKL